ncbi:TPA: DUF4240 domain-containing protein [Listeria monocytogenes]|nr:DUF4240 domain-containing protein [Listeria monocytogenes]HBJ9076588.1 DUF4240 domain-containing protein [Listeria monocytogenes]HBJ9801276.1 DUF4240 domain-containing protein [Listeria monocytogenes]
MKKVSSLLTQDQFWGIIDNSDKGSKLEELLEKLSEDELFGYDYWSNYFHKKSYNQSLWAVAYVVLGGCSDDGFDYFRYWLITRGKAVFTSAVENADTLCGEFDLLTEDEYPENEEVAYLVMDIFENKLGKDFDDAENEAESRIEFEEVSMPPIDFEWDEDDEDSIKKVCPNTFAKWWNNDKF